MYNSVIVYININERYSAMIKSKLLITITCALTASLGFSALAFSGGDGTSANPYKISTSGDFIELAELSETETLEGKFFVQTSDIYFNGASVSVAKKSEIPFMGSYNGMDYDITGLDFTAKDGASGLFINTKNAVLKNIEIKDAVLNASTVSGSIVAKATGETLVESCAFDGTITLPVSSLLGCNIGGIAGIVENTACVSDCESSIKITATKCPLILYVGGITGYNKGTIAECSAYVDINAVSNNYIAGFGGIAGENCGTITGCETLGNISGQITNDVAQLYIGGVVAHNNGGKIERTVNKANLHAIGYNTYPCYIGGIAGYNQNGEISVSGNNGAVDGAYSFAGGVTGINYASDGPSIVTECLNMGEITISGGITGGLVGGNLATDKSENVSTVSSSLNLYVLTEGKGAIGSMQHDFVGITVANNLFVRNMKDSNAKTLTDAELTSASSISGLNSQAWIYPDGLLPSLAVVKNLNKAEAIGASVNKDTGKVAYTVYNPGNEFKAVAVIVFMKNNRVIGTKFDNITAKNGYDVHTADSSFAKDADNVKIIVVDTLTGLAPIIDGDNF